MSWRENHGSQPADTKGKRMAVELFNGRVDGVEPYSTVAPKGWTCDDANWTISDPPKTHEIRLFKLH